MKKQTRSWITNPGSVLYYSNALRSIAIFTVQAVQVAALPTVQAEYLQVGQAAVHCLLAPVGLPVVSEVFPVARQAQFLQVLVLASASVQAQASEVSAAGVAEH